MTDIDPDVMRVTLCKIHDAEFIEHFGPNDNTYEAHIVLLCEDQESGLLFQAPISDEALKALTGMDRTLNTKEMVKTKDALAAWKGDVMLVYSPEHQEITYDMIAAGADIARARLAAKAALAVDERPEEPPKTSTTPDGPSDRLEPQEDAHAGPPAASQLPRMKITKFDFRPQQAE
jgi:hypothetical protein